MSMNALTPAQLASQGKLGLAALALISASSLIAQSFEHHQLAATDAATGDLLGSAVATSGARIAVGAPGADESGTDSGSAYIFRPTNGSQTVELVASDGAAGDRFGTAIAIDNGLALVGAPFADGAGSDTGAAYVFDPVSGLELFKLEASDAAAGDHFGHAVALDGNTAVIGSLGAAYVFDIATGQELFKLLPTGASTTFGMSGFGEAVDIDNGLAVVGARLENGASGFAGAAYLFDATSGTQLHRMLAINGTAWANFGASVAIDGNVVVIGSPEASPMGWHSGTAYLFDATSGQQTSNITPGDGHLQAKFGSSVAVDGLHIVIGSEQNHAGGVFTSGAAYLYEYATGTFLTKLVASNAGNADELGGAVAAGGGQVVAGAARDDDNGNDSGAAYIFDNGASVVAMAQCLTNAGNLLHVDGVPVAGQTLTLRMDTAQPGTMWAVLAMATNPVTGWPTCGVSLASAGELLIGPALHSVASLWSGTAADFTVNLPMQSGLTGFSFYVQGAFVAPATSVEPIRLSNGLNVVLGGYL